MSFVVVPQVSLLVDGDAATATITFAVNARSLLLVTSNGDRVAAPGEYALSFEIGDGKTSEAIAVKLVGPQVVVEPFPTAAY